MICPECLERIAELERLERIYEELHKTLRNLATTPMSQSEHDAIAIRERDVKLDKLISRLELKRHQRHHVTAKPPRTAYSYSAETAAA
jgi:predicted transcriptional regulator